MVCLKNSRDKNGGIEQNQTDLDYKTVLKMVVNRSTSNF